MADIISVKRIRRIFGIVAGENKRNIDEGLKNIQTLGVNMKQLPDEESNTGKKAITYSTSTEIPEFENDDKTKHHSKFCSHD